MALIWDYRQCLSVSKLTLSFFLLLFAVGCLVYACSRRRRRNCQKVRRLSADALFARCPEYCLFRFHFVSVFFGVNSRSNLSELLRPHTEQRVVFQQLTDPSNHGIFSQWHALPTFRGLLDLVFAQAGVTITNN